MSEEAHRINYVKIWAILVVLLVVSVIGPFAGIKWITLVTAFGVAVVKARLVVQNFMHLRIEKRIIKWTLATTLVLMLLLVAGVAPDVMEHRGMNWTNDAALAAVERGVEEGHGRAAEHELTGEDEAGAIQETDDGREPPGSGVTDEDHGTAVAQVEDSGPESVGSPATARSGQQFDARAAFNTTCSVCHGKAGDGNGPGAAALDPKPANFTDPAFWETRTDEEIFKAIKEGGAAVGRSPLMVAWGATYSDDQIHAIVAYLKTFRRK